jgi:hypothetical protein
VATADWHRCSRKMSSECLLFSLFLSLTLYSTVESCSWRFPRLHIEARGFGPQDESQVVCARKQMAELECVLFSLIVITSLGLTWNNILEFGKVRRHRFHMLSQAEVRGCCPEVILRRGFAASFLLGSFAVRWCKYVLSNYFKLVGSMVSE